jgi:poly(hydroxyalkanoate) depolymerase family esterase
MPPFEPKNRMQEALRLTKAGKLKEALLVLRDALPGAAAPKPVLRPVPVIPPLVPAGISELVGDFMDRMGGHAPHRAAPLPDGGSFEEHEFVAAAGKRHYKLFVPPGYHGQKLPLVVMLHGCTQSPNDFAAGTRMNELATAQNFLVLYPAQSRSANFSKCWNWFNAADQRRGAGEPSLIAGMTEQVMKDYAIDSGSVFVAGLSAGGAAAAVMGAAYPELYAAVGVHSGLACGAAANFGAATAAMRNGAPAGTPRPNVTLVPTIVFHGDADSTVSAVNAGQVLAQAAAGVDLTKTASEATANGMAYTRTELRDPAGDTMLESWLLHGAGHAWSGGSKDGSYTDPNGPDASAEMLRFFMAHSRRQKFW